MPIYIYIYSYIYISLPFSFLLTGLVITSSQRKTTAYFKKKITKLKVVWLFNADADADFINPLIGFWGTPLILNIL